MRTVLITGATSGFGKLMVEIFLANGDQVIATGRNLSKRREIFEKQRQSFPGRVHEYDLDVTNIEQIIHLKNELLQQFERLDILINNAGYGMFGALEEFDPEQIKAQMEVNFFGTVYVTQAFLPPLRSAKGKIFNFSSVFGFMGFPLTSLYCASKFAVEGFSESLRTELSSMGVQVCLIRPGGYRTDFGKNLQWNIKSAGSIYEMKVKKYQKLHEYFSKKKVQEPMDVAKGVYRLSIKKRLPMTKVFGQDGCLSYLLKTFIPEFIYFIVFEALINKVFSAQINKT